MTIQEAINAVISKRDLSYDEARQIFTLIMEGSATPAQIAALLVALRMKGETVNEITAAAQAMREKVLRITVTSSDHLVDTGGTGGDNSGSFNISTAAAFIAAGAGARVAKHGNRSVSSKSGSADVLEALGVNICADAQTMTRCLNEIGICFLFAPSLHPAMKYAIGPRREIGVRTIFNILGPLTNPAFAPAQLTGVFSAALTVPLAEVLNKLGSRRAFVVNGADGLDEITTTAETHVAELCNGTITSRTIVPEEFGFVRARAADLAGSTPQDNASIIREIFAGKRGPQRDVAVLNAAFALTAAGKAASPHEGIRLAETAIDTGAAREKLRLLVEMTNSSGAKG